MHIVRQVAVAGNAAVARSLGECLELDPPELALVQGAGPPLRPGESVWAAGSSSHLSTLPASGGVLPGVETPEILSCRELPSSLL